MCQQYLTLYDWCFCEENAGYQECSARSQKSNACPGVAFQTVRMQCFCNVHATKKFKTEKQSQKKKSRSSLSSWSSRSSRYSEASLEVKDPQQTPVLRRRWYRPWTRTSVA